MPAGSTRTRDVYVATLGENVLAVSHRMREHDVGTVVVLDEHGKPAGILTDRHLAMRVIAEEFGQIGGLLHAEEPRA